MKVWISREDVGCDYDMDVFVDVIEPVEYNDNHDGWVSGYQVPPHMKMDCRLAENWLGCEIPELPSLLEVDLSGDEPVVVCEWVPV